MTPLRSLGLDDLTLTDEGSYRHVGIYRELKQAMSARGLRFLVPTEGSGVDRYGSVLLLNLAFWQPEDVAEVLVDDVLAADQLAHNAWHRLAHAALGEHARTADAILLAESIASAFDLYLVGRLVGHAPDSEFLETQVPAMREAAENAGVDAAGFEAIVERAVANPEQAFEQLRQLLFDTSTALVRARGVEEAAAILAIAAKHPMGALLHHYELPTWVLYARAYASSAEPSDAVRTIDRELRGAADPIDWLERHWLA